MHGSASFRVLHICAVVVFSIVYNTLMKEITVEALSSPGCHNCQVFEDFWNSVASEYPNVKYRHIEITDPEGMEMASKYSIFSSPGIVVNGELFSTGGVNKDEFLAKIKELSK
jgi:alkyl hydroperoxide reductase subunit AhpF